MSQENIGNTSAESPEIKADSGLNPKVKAAWSSPNLTRLDGKETQGIAPSGPKGAPGKPLPEEMVFFGS